MGRRKYQKTYHTHALPGKRVRVTLHSGEQFIDRFKQYARGSKYEFVKHGTIKEGLIKKVEVYSKSRETNTALIRVNRQSQR